MASKIKKILTGHSDKKNSRHGADGALECEDKGAQHHTGHAHHDPEIETKKATSAAGNYPYWGKKDGETHGNRTDGAASGSKDLTNGRKKQSGKGTGALATGAGAAGGLNGAAREQDPLYASTRARKASTSSYPDGGTIVKKYSKEEAIIVAGAGVAGGSHHVERARRNSRRSSTGTKPRVAFTEENATSGPQTGVGATSSADHHHNNNHHHDPETEAKKATSEAGNYPHWGEGHSKRDGEFAAGAGAAGLAGAGYYGSKNRDERNEGQHTYSSREAPTGTNISREAATATSIPSSFAELETSTRDVDPYPPTSSTGHPQYHNHIHRENEGVIASEAGLGAAGSSGTDTRIRHDECHEGEERDSFTGYNSNELTPAQLASRGTSNEQPLDDVSRDRDVSQYNNSTSENYSHGRNNKNLRSELGTATGTGAGGLASNHGQGKDYEDTPGTFPSDEAAHTSSGVGSTPERGTKTDLTGKPLIHNT
ncbi:hypothetical protein VPNG_03436 [Cytospora leucostoma]|uniref:Uncharacterized protein n=1 Tax=Cytospora leucostoma TaxID=1230097 RepID=A0A423XFF4_9PEZI|nr:hypothetical protein VPNG_03436 [Cytospora leucostoma]